MSADNNWQSSPYIVILYYNAFSCGKFVSNILSFNKNFVAQIPLSPSVKRYNSVIESLSQNFDEQVLEDYKLSQIFQTIPGSKQECKNWYDYELDCMMFWGFLSNNLDMSNLNTVAIELLKHKKYCFITAHDFDNWSKVQAVFPNAKTVEIVNDSEIRRRSIELKSRQPYGTNINKSLPNSFKFDIDSLFDKELFFQKINELYKCFNIDDASMHPSVYEYYRQYVNLYE